MSSDEKKSEHPEKTSNYAANDSEYEEFEANFNDLQLADNHKKEQFNQVAKLMKMTRKMSQKVIMMRDSPNIRSRDLNLDAILGLKK